MVHNALIAAFASIPAGRDARRSLGLPFHGRAPGRGDGAAALFVRLEALSRSQATLLKRLTVSCGGTAEAEADVRGGGFVALLGGDPDRLGDLFRRAARHLVIRQAAGEAAEALGIWRAPPRTLSLERGVLPLGPPVLVMGILNVTPDSFSDGGRFLGRRAAVAHALHMAEEGAAIIDVGGESTRPGSRPVPLREELARVMPVLEAIGPALDRLGARRPLLSIDTTKAEVARQAAAAGVDLINDVSGLTFDPAMAAVAAQSELPVVISHIRKTPRTMGKAPRYRHLLPEIASFLRRGIALATRAGVRENRIVVDPGIGFGKSRGDNLAILRHLAVLRTLGRPILIGASRKSFIGGTLELPVGERLEGSLAAEALAIAHGADIIRAHDVRPAVRVAVLCSAVTRSLTG